MKYDPYIHDLGYVIRDLDARVDRIERSLREYFSQAIENRYASASALDILNEGDQ